MTKEEQLRIQIAWSCRILAMHGHADMTLGHVSARGADGLIYIKRKGIGLDEVRPEDVISIDMDANKVAGEGEVHLESSLHAEVYKVRKDVSAIVHSHPMYSTALGASKGKLAMLNHDSLLFYEGISIFEETAGLVSNAGLGSKVALALGKNKTILLRNHGVLVVGKSVPWMTYTSLTLERAVQIQSIAKSFGEFSTLPEETVHHLFEEKYRDVFTESYWHYLIRKVHRAGLAHNMPDSN
jgi:L-fuculose-phosphate aldolase